jgi:RNA 3'-terminal phosphate cyclase (ATP)
MELIRYYTSGAPLDQHLADQIVLYLALCDEKSDVVVASVTQHLLTNLWVIGRFRRFSYHVDGELGKPGRVKINS